MICLDVGTELWPVISSSRCNALITEHFNADKIESHLCSDVYNITVTNKNYFILMICLDVGTPLWWSVISSKIESHLCWNLNSNTNKYKIYFMLRLHFNADMFVTEMKNIHQTCFIVSPAENVSFKLSLLCFFRTETTHSLMNLNSIRNDCKIDVLYF